MIVMYCLIIIFSSSVLIYMIYRIVDKIRKYLKTKNNKKEINKKEILEEIHKDKNIKELSLDKKQIL